jgi:hypothetical protein
MDMSIVAGMKLVSIDGKEIAGMPSEDLGPLILGPLGTVVSVSWFFLLQEMHDSDFEPSGLNRVGFPAE